MASTTSALRGEPAPGNRAVNSNVPVRARIVEADPPANVVGFDGVSTPFQVLTRIRFDFDPAPF